MISGIELRGRDRLATARNLVEQGAVSVVSLDVFDTVLWRCVPRPTDAFMLLGQRLHDAGGLRPWVDPYIFRRLRIAAEARARRLKDRAGAGVEVNLQEIWDQFPSHVLAEGWDGRAPEWEVTVEREVTRPDLDIADFAAFAHGRGCRLALVTNTYFSRQQLARLLARPELLPLEQARIFPSSAYGVSKAAGLWQMVLDELEVPATRVLHVGDEQASDVSAPSKLGIRTFHFERLGPSLESALVREGTLLPEPISPAAQTVNLWVGDFGVTGVRAKVDGRLPDDDLNADLAAAWRYGATVLGPVLTGFAEWLHRQAEGLKVPVVWCMMREGELLADLLNRVASHHGSGIEGRPVWLSRQLTARSAIVEASEAELRRLLVRRLPPTAGQFVANLGLSPAEVPELKGLLGQLMDRAAVVDPVLSAVLTSTHLRGRIVEESAAARHRLISYLQNTLDGLDGPVVLADLGWGGTIQAQLADVLKLAGVPARLVGLYLAVNDSANERILDGSDMVGYLTSCGVPEFDVSQISRSPEVIEQACLATAGSVVDIDDRGEPVLDHFATAPDQVISKLVTQHGIRAFQQEWLRYAAAVDGWSAFDGGERSLLLNILRSSITSPTPDEARVFGSWAHEDNFGADDRDHLVSERLGRFAPYMSPLDLLELTTQDVYWPFGLAARYDPALASATIATLEGAVEPEVFEPGRVSRRARLWLDCGAGFAHPQERSLRVNRNGLSYLRFAVDQPGIVSLRLDPSDGSAVFRIDWIDLTMKVAGQARPQRLRLESEADLAGLVYSNCRWLYGGVALTTTGVPQVHIPLAGRVAGSVYGVKVEVALAVMDLPSAGGPVQVGPELGNRLAWVLARARSEAAQGGIKAVGQGAWRAARRTLGR